MNRTSFRAMGTEIVAFGSDGSGVAEFFAEAEAVFSRFDPDSQLSTLNADPRSSVDVTPEMAACLRAAAELRLRTGGLVDPAVGNSVAAWGYDRS
ncbi:MAG: FAD:protein FMN transferase, partial [bacterium]|nr:FAD:protein FMN transferase [bacterium]